MGRAPKRGGQVLAACLCALSLAACVEHPAGRPSPGFLTPQVARAYIPLQGSAYIVLEGLGAATVIAPGIAATNAHNANLVDSSRVIGRSPTYDLLFFRTDRGEVPPVGEPKLGMKVVAYGHGAGDDVREASGPVADLQAPVLPECPHCPVQEAFVYRAEAGEGFSGGPVVDLGSGRVVGITFGFRDGVDDKHPAQRLMYAYDMRRVFAELRKIEARRTAAACLPHDQIR